MKQTSILITILFFSLAVNAQNKVTVGMLGGLSSSNFYDNDDNLKKENLISYSLGADIGYILNDNLSFRANLMYEEKGQKMSYVPFENQVIIIGNPSPQFSTNFNLNYLTLNLLARGSFGKKIKFIAEGGPYVGYLLSAKNVTTSNLNGYPSIPTSQDIKSGYKSTNFGIVAGFGLEYQLNTKVSISLTIRRSLGLSAITKENSRNYNNNLKTNSMLGLVGANFSL